MTDVIEDTRVGLIGKTIGRYRVTAELGRGGMATVYRAHDPQLGRDVAIKVMHGAFAGRAELEARFRREARAVAGIKHDGIVNVFDFAPAAAGEPGYIVTEIVEGPTLRAVMDRHGGRLWPEVATLVAVRLAGALGAAHARGIVHRDVKPDNVMFDLASPATARVLLTDFGIAHMTEAETMTATGAIVGSPIYMSPEQARGQEIGPASDVFSLGVLIYHIIAGRPPFSGRDPLTAIAAILRGEFPRPSQIDARVGPALEAVILRCMKTAPAERFPDGNALATALADLAADVEKMLGSHDGDAGAALRRFFDDEPAAPGATTAETGATARAGTRAHGGHSFAATLAPRVAEQAFDQARRHARRGELARALAETNRVFAYVPDHAGARALLAGIARRRRTAKLAAAGLAAVTLVGGGVATMHRWRPVHGSSDPFASVARERARPTTTMMVADRAAGRPANGGAKSGATDQAPAQEPATSPPPATASSTTTSSPALTPGANGASKQHKPAAHLHASAGKPAAPVAATKTASSSPQASPPGGAPIAPPGIPQSSGDRPTPGTPGAISPTATPSPVAPAPPPPAPAPPPAPPPPARPVLRASQGFCSPSMDDLKASIHPSYDHVASGIHRIFCTLPGQPKSFVADYDLRAGSHANLVIVPGSDGKPTLSRPD